MTVSEAAKSAGIEWGELDSKFLVFLLVFSQTEGQIHLGTESRRGFGTVQA